MTEERLREIVTELHFWARRYADGRATYVTPDFNNMTRELLATDFQLREDGGTIWAKDQHGRKFDGLTDEEVRGSASWVTIVDPVKGVIDG